MTVYLLVLPLSTVTTLALHIILLGLIFSFLHSMYPFLSLFLRTYIPTLCTATG